VGFCPKSGACGVRPPTRSSLPSCSRPSRTLRAADAVARRRAILDRHCARRHEARAGRGGRMVPIEQKDGTRAGVDWWVSVKGLTPTPPSEPLKPSTGAAVRDHRNAVRDRSESLSAIDRNHCPHSPESARRAAHCARARRVRHRERRIAVAALAVVMATSGAPSAPSPSSNVSASGMLFVRMP
jgi:hypothetical protein